jgi:septal ring factor EnvC (AmiA/AmiB activator)
MKEFSTFADGYDCKDCQSSERQIKNLKTKITELEQENKNLHSLWNGSMAEVEKLKSNVTALEKQKHTLEARVEKAEQVIEQVQNHCLCERSSYGFDYHEKHRKLGPPESGKRWLTPVDMARTYLQNKGGKGES